MGGDVVQQRGERVTGDRGSSGLWYTTFSLDPPVARELRVDGFVDASYCVPGSAARTGSQLHDAVPGAGTDDKQLAPEARGHGTELRSHHHDSAQRNAPQQPSRVRKPHVPALPPLRAALPHQSPHERHQRALHHAGKSRQHRLEALIGWLARSHDP